jgi:hypothetical protein
MSWEHAADYEPGTLGREMYELEKKALELGAEGVGVLAGVDQLTAKIDGYRDAAIRAHFDS